MAGTKVLTGGVRIHVAHDEGSSPGDRAPPLVLLHGFTGSSATWREVLGPLSMGRRVVALDLLGHGASDAPFDPEPYGFEACVGQVLGTWEALGISQADLLGYSLGGRVAMHVALAARGQVRRLVLESASPGIADAQARAMRLQQDLHLAERIEDEGVERFVHWWMHQPMFATQRRLGDAHGTRSLEDRLANTAHGLANSLRGKSVGLQEPLHDRLASLEVPALLVSGERDAKFTAQLAELAGRWPAARHVVVPGAGHNVHIEAPQAFAAAVEDFLDG